MARCRAPISSMASRMARNAIGSPHPGHRLCSATSSSDGEKSSTRCAGSVGGASVTMNRSAIQDLQESVAQVVAVEIGGDAEPGAVEAQAADELDRHRAFQRETDVVDHLA